MIAMGGGRVCVPMPKDAAMPPLTHIFTSASLPGWGIKMQKFIKGILNLALILGAAICFFATLDLAFNDKASSATVTAFMGLGCAALFFLPIFESFEAFGLSAKLKTQVTEAETLLKNIRTSAIVASRLSYVQVAWMNRMAVPSTAEKRKLLADAEENLRQLNVEDHLVAEIREPFLRFISADLYSDFKSLLSRRSSEAKSELDRVIREEFPNGPTVDMRERFDELQRQRLAISDINDDFYQLIRSAPFWNIQSKMTELIANSGLSVEDRGSLQRTANWIAGLSDDCWEVGTSTREVELFLERYGDMDGAALLYEQTFGGRQ